MSSKFMTNGSERPTLPSIHTLELPLLTRSTLSNVQYAPEINARPIRFNVPTNKMNHDRRVSTSSSATSSSRSSSPTSPPDGFSSRLPSTLPPNFRLVPCEMENAEAVILFPPPGAQDANVSNYSTHNGKGGGILLVGPALHKICRNPQRPLAKGARVHPYRVALGENPNKSRRASVISVTAFPTAGPHAS
ncbi:hypothetical protein BJ912DRAFT_965156 [Pholiota molesta]|nr:hypothetical protein BJ912DRAFT_965156 [Pholiota molesta]